MHSKQRAEYHLYMSRLHDNLAMTRVHAQLAKDAKNDMEAMDHDYQYIKHMAQAVFCLTHARNLRIKEKTNYGNQF